MPHGITEEENGKTPRVLLAEDDHTEREITLQFLSSAGYRVDAVENGLVAVASFEKRRYDLILMDVAMPLMSGYLACHAIRALERKIPAGSTRTKAHRVPIIAFTAFPMSSCKEDYIRAGMDDCLSKPYAVGELLRMMAKWLNSQVEEIPCTGTQESSLF